METMNETLTMIGLKCNLRRKKLHRMNQDSNRLGSVLTINARAQM